MVCGSLLGRQWKVHFPDFSGRAEPVMMLLEYAGIKYQFKRYDITAAQKQTQNT